MIFVVLFGPNDCSGLIGLSPSLNPHLWLCLSLVVRCLCSFIDIQVLLSVLPLHFRQLVWFRSPPRRRWTCSLRAPRSWRRRKSRAGAPTGTRASRGARLLLLHLQPCHCASCPQYHSCGPTKALRRHRLAKACVANKRCGWSRDAAGCPCKASAAASCPHCRRLLPRFQKWLKFLTCHVVPGSLCALYRTANILFTLWFIHWHVFVHV